MDVSKDRTETADNGDESGSAADKSSNPGYPASHPPFVQMFFDATPRGQAAIDEQFMDDVRAPESTSE